MKLLSLRNITYYVLRRNTVYFSENRSEQKFFSKHITNSISLPCDNFQSTFPSQNPCSEIKAFLVNTNKHFAILPRHCNILSSKNLLILLCFVLGCFLMPSSLSPITIPFFKNFPSRHTK